MDDRVRNPGTGEWETAQTILDDVAVFGKLAEQAVDRLQTGDAVLMQGEFRFQTYQDIGGEDADGDVVRGVPSGAGSAAGRRDRGPGSGRGMRSPASPHRCP